MDYLSSEAEVLGGQAIVLHVSDTEGTWVFPCILRKLPPKLATPHFTSDAVSVNGYTDPVTSGRVPRVGDVLADGLRRSQILTIFSRLDPLASNCSGIGGEGDGWLSIERTRGATVSMDTSGTIEDVRHAMGSSDRNRINRLERDMDARVVAPDSASLTRFVRVYRTAMEDIGVSDRYLFTERQLSYVRSVDGFQIVEVWKDSEIICSGLFAFGPNNAHFHLSGTVPQHRSASPARLMIYRAAQEAVEGGLPRLHLGGGVGGRKDDGLFRFKRGLGSDLHEFRTWEFVSDLDAYRRLSGHVDGGFFPSYRRDEAS